MNRPRAAISALATRLRPYLAQCAACAGAAIVAIALSLIAMSAIVLAVNPGTGGEPILHVAFDDGATLFYLTQLVGVSFFHHTAGLRFAALPGLALIGLSIVAATAVIAKMAGGTVRKRMLIAMLMPIPYALFSGLGACYLSLRFTAPGIGQDISVVPSAVEAFVLPLGWGLLFAPIGGLVAAFGKGWRREASRLLGQWATPIGCSLRVLTTSLVLVALAVLAGSVAVIAHSGEARSLTGGGFGHLLTVVAAAVVVLPTLVVTMFLACFGVSFDWRMEVLIVGTDRARCLAGHSRRRARLSRVRCPACSPYAYCSPWPPSSSPVG